MSTEESPDPVEKEENHLPDMKEMRSVVLTGFGGLNKMRVMKRPEPTPQEGEVMIRVKACGVNFYDLMVRQGAIDNPPKTPLVLGFECSGEVESVGEGVTDFQVGNKVMGISNFGAWSELVTLPAKFCFLMPDGLSFEDAAALPISYVTAYILLFEIGNLKKGRSVLVHSAGGAVGTAIAQLTKTIGNITLFGTASAHKHETLKDDWQYLFDRLQQDYHQEVKKVAPEGVDLVLDCLCGDDTNKGYSLLKPMGKYILYGSSNVVSGETRSFFSFAKAWWQVDKINPLKLYDENKSISGFMLQNLIFNQGHVEVLRDVMVEIVKLYKDGKIKPVIDSVYAFEEISEAMQKLHDRKNIGKVVISPLKEPQPKPEKPLDSQASVSSDGEKEQEKAEEAK
ncbi:synaptic vesicle membrane protein VAT-1 homolog-like [Saccoglossus kowalevskii]|uniref:Synaptic vesicle membrane protein VAT-1 homolog-like isoform X1 n=1 Tax=Saccoglossus kowalevskii TaxID=10224 RepID=A0ABM0MA69_SACKO|nr:PREDICTED: synaptic vesicle membrane protein VAT-1 homolog-like isoform X1 [Saccoglossus kowalevskii]XP_006816910.1 PREDICTED: synaptic vesicle membrane protein VAT-1 homolog-like isoform X2 [Saccoglossus kowalevskii]